MFPEFGTEASRADARLAEVRVRAVPARIQGASVEATITAGGVHVDWAEDDRGQLALALRQGTAGGQAATVFPVDTLLLDVAAKQQEVVDALVAIVTESGAGQGSTSRMSTSSSLKPGHAGRTCTRRARSGAVSCERVCCSQPRRSLATI